MYSELQKSSIPIVNAVLNYVQESGTHVGDWVAGITDQPGIRLPHGHGVKLLSDRVICVAAPNEATARLVEECLLDPVLVGMSGGPGGETTGNFADAHRKNSHTTPHRQHH